MPSVSVPDFQAQLAPLVEAPPEGDGWLHEQKFDGYRIGLRKDGRLVELWSRRGQNWTAQLPALATAGAKLAARRALLDGEVAVLLPSGLTSFQALQNRRPDSPLAYFVFDLLHLDGRDLRDQPLEARKEKLRALLAASPSSDLFRYSDHVVGGGAAFFRDGCALGLEGIVSKRLGARYRSGRSRDWQETKCSRRQELVLGGSTDPEGAREGIGALLSGDGRIRHPSMQGLHADKDPREVRREAPASLEKSAVRPTAKRQVPAVPASAPAGAAEVRGIAISHPDRLIYTDLRLTKLDIARYYGEVAPAMVPHTAGRPLTLLRCGGPIDYRADKGGCTMLRHGKAWGPRQLRRVKIRELRKTGEYLVADTPEALVALAQMGIVEVHTWNARAETPYSHDRVVFDLDPGPEVAWPAVMAAARLVRQLLSEKKLRAWVKTTGGKGLHVVVPISPADGAACLAFAQSVAQALVESAPRRFTTSPAKLGRERQILVDVLRNGRANTAVAAYALRARRGATVSTPLDWDELTPRLDPGRFTLRTAVARSRQPDPWATYWRARQKLPSF
jgi:bifunctional non-homologous end joining protein LigD